MGVGFTYDPRPKTYNLLFLLIGIKPFLEYNIISNQKPADVIFETMREDL